MNILSFSNLETMSQFLEQNGLSIISCSKEKEDYTLMITEFEASKVNSLLQIVKFKVVLSWTLLITIY